jgi:lysozyme
MARTINRETIEHVKRWEGLKLTAYPDPGSRDGTPWTIGYGHTSDGHMKVYRGLTITPAQAEAALEYDLNEAAAAVDAAVKVPLTDNQFGALVSFAMNVGLGDPKNKRAPPGFLTSTLLKKLNRGDYASVPGELARWNKNDGKVMDGLINRRAAEAGLWAKGSFVSSKHVTAEPDAPPIVDKETVSWGATILASLGALFAGSGPVQWALGVIMVGAFGIGAYLFLTKRLAPK